MAEIRIADHIVAGYYLVRIANRPEYVSAELMPDRILSISDDICNSFPDTWVIDWTSENIEERIERASEFAIPAANLEKVVSWGTKTFSKAFAWPNVFYSVDNARAARTQFLSHLDDIVLIGLGLHKLNVDQFLSASKPPPQQPGFAPVGATGVFEIASRRDNLAENGRSLGYELLVAQHGLLTCSWLCNGLEKTFSENIGVRPNTHGFISSFEEASRCIKYMSDAAVGAEPGLWLPWLIVKYS